MFTDFDEFFKLQAVGARHSHGGDLQSMNRIREPLNIAGNRFAVAIREEGCRLSLMQHKDRVDAYASFAFAIVTVVPRTQFEATAMIAGAEGEYVTFAQTDALRLFYRFQFRPAHCVIWFEPLLIGDMTKRVNVSVAVSMTFAGQIVRAELRLP